MIDRVALLATLKPVVGDMEDSIRERALATREIAEHLTREHHRAVVAERTAMSLEEWREGEITQAAVAWILACVFIRFLEDNRLIDRALIAGSGDRRAAALGHRDEHFRSYPEHSDREYLEACFRDVARFPAVTPLFDQRHNPLWLLGPTADGARALREVFTAIDPDTGVLVHDFSDGDLDTRFLGDLYQDLSETAKKRYALLQTPDFVERFILDRTLNPALARYGLDTTRLIDPACGSGHFLIDAFLRLYALWAEREPGTNATVLAQRALDQIAGVDLNPFATAIARFRLIIAALRVCGIPRLVEAPAFSLSLATGDSLLHGPLPADGATMLFDANRLSSHIAHVFEAEDAEALRVILGRGYHAVVANPPYIKVDDAKLRSAIKARYASCSGQWVLTVPFMERFVELAATPDGPGYIGQITGSAFSKREFGKRLVQDHMRTWDIEAIYDVSGIHLPGHGTDVVLIFGTAASPQSTTVVFGMKERGDPAGSVGSPAWDELLEHQLDTGHRGTYFSVAAVERRTITQHPWSFGSAGAQQVLARINAASPESVEAIASDAGFGAISGADPVFLASETAPAPAGSCWKPTVVGDSVRDWFVSSERALVTFSGDDASACWPAELRDQQRLWRARPVLARRLRFGTPITDVGLEWYAWRETYPSKLNATRVITFGEITTRNQFALRAPDVVTTRTSPVLTLSAAASSSTCFELLEYLNSSTACFYFMQVCAKKGANVSKKRTRDERFVFNARSVVQAPLPSNRAGNYAEALVELAHSRLAAVDRLVREEETEDFAEQVSRARKEDDATLAKMRFAQEELDWCTYARFELSDLPVWNPSTPQLVGAGERAFEMRIARQSEPAAEDRMWFERDGIPVIKDGSDAWDADYAQLVERRIAAIEESDVLRVLEQPKHKRRWPVPTCDELIRDRCRRLLIEQIDALPIWSDGRLHSAAEIADAVRRDRGLIDRLRFAVGSIDEELADACDRLLRSVAVSEPAAVRYSSSGLAKHALWTRAWEEQRTAERELGVASTEPCPPIDASTALGRGYFGSFVPPEYKPEDYASRHEWSVRGKLDVPNEWFFVVHGAGRAADSTAVYGRASWTAVDRARAVATRAVERADTEGLSAAQATPLLTTVLELLTWIHQWHPDSDPLYGGSPGQYFEGWLDGQLAAFGITRESLSAWRPPTPSRGRKATAS